MKKIRIFALLMLLALCAGITSLTVSADEIKETSIVGHNLALEDNIEIVYIVEEIAPQGAETGVLFWLTPQEEYVYGEQEYKITTPFGTVVNPNTGNTCQKYAFNYLSAKQMTEDVYAVSFIKDGENITYSSVDKYSILQYAYNKKNSETVLDGGTASLGEMLSAMLDYGAITQQYFGYNLDRLANATYYRVTVNGGALSDGLNYGLYKDGETVTVIANEPESGKQFKQWIDEGNNVISTEPEYEFNVDKDLSLTATYEDRVTEGLAYTLNSDGKSYSVSGMGTATDTDVFIPSTYNDKPVTSIGKFAFYNCTSLTSITIPDSVTSIVVGAFSYCSSLTSITIPYGVTNIESQTFSYCTSLTSITIPDSVTSIGDRAFIVCNNLTSIIIPNSVMSIGYSAFAYCTSLTSVTIPDSVMSIEFNTFQSCTSLEVLTIGNSVTSIANNAFCNCSSLTSITIPDSVTTIDAYAFNGCIGLTTITIGNGVTSIGNGAFDGCNNLNSVYYKGTSADWKNIPMFTGVSNEDLTNAIRYYYSEEFPTEFIGNYYWHYVDSEPVVWEITFTPDEYFTFTLLDNDTYEVKRNDSETLPTSLIIPSTYNDKPITSIGSYAFKDCSGLTTITIPDSVISIGFSAFYGCSGLTRVNYTGIIDKWCEISFESTQSNPLFYAKNLYINNELMTKATLTTATKINAFAFYNCSRLTTITIPNSVTSIEDRVFYMCSRLTTITISNSITNIGNYAFYRCDSLTSITFNGTIAQWNAISKGANWKNNVPATVVHCSNGDVAI